VPLNLLQRKERKGAFGKYHHQGYLPCNKTYSAVGYRNGLWGRKKKRSILPSATSAARRFSSCGDSHAAQRHRASPLLKPCLELGRSGLHLQPLLPKLICNTHCFSNSPLTEAPECFSGRTENTCLPSRIFHMKAAYRSSWQSLSTGNRQPQLPVRLTIQLVSAKEARPCGFSTPPVSALSRSILGTLLAHKMSCVSRTLFFLWKWYLIFK